tara:strand:+ start:1055 stop:2338 length:1284 start_codon:yes stop_codon:yes gene_type:complete
MEEVILKVDKLSKQYRLGSIGTGTLSSDLKRLWYLVRGKKDPFLKIGEVNDRAKKGGDYVWALKDINVEIKKGQIVGIIGKNGAGKTTLLKILSRVTNPSSGTVKIKGKIASLLAVGTGFHPELTGKENIYLNGAILGMTTSEIKNKYNEIVDFSGVERYIDTPVKRYSTGMYVRLAFAVAAHLEPDILIVDEVLAVGDAEFQKKSIGKMKDVANEGRTVLFVSHNMATINALCETCILMENGMVKDIGKTSDIIEKYLKDDLSVTTSTRIIPENAKRQGTGEAIFEYITVLNDDNSEVSKLSFKQNIQIKLKLKVLKNIPSALIWVSVYTSEGVEILLAESIKENLVFDEGEYEILVKLDAQLIPGDYIIKPSIYWTGGANAGIDVLDEGLDFTIMSHGLDVDNSYEYSKSYGYIYAESEWDIKEI